MTWLSRNAPSIEALAAVVTALVAAAALVGVTVQLDEADRLQKEQSAREAFRAHLALAATLPQFALPQDTCGLISSDEVGAYTAFVDHLLYSAEQMLAVADGWEATFLTQLAPHETYLCTTIAPLGETLETAQMLARFRQENCPAVQACQ